MPVRFTGAASTGEEVQDGQVGSLGTAGRSRVKLIRKFSILF